MRLSKVIKAREITLVAIAFLAASVVAIGGTSAGRTTVAVPGDDSDSPEPRRIGQDYLVAAGSTGATGNWELHAYDSDMGLCVDLVVAGGSSGACGFELRQERVGRALYDVGIGQVELGTGDTFTYGAVVRGAGRAVRLEFADSSVMTVNVLAGPGALRFDFFMTRAPKAPGFSSATTNLTSVTVVRSNGTNGQTRALK